MNIITDHRCTEYHRPGHPEQPKRISRTVEKLRAQTELTLSWLEPPTVKDEWILQAHEAPLLARLEQPVDMDPDTPAHPGIAEHARRSVAGGLMAMRQAMQGQKALSLLRPPGHHATRARAMGFCYLNTMAIAVLAARKAGLDKVAVFDFDVHHGNGTEAILLNNAGCAFFSVHQYPAYPGSGTRSIQNSHNYPVAPNTPRLEYRSVLEHALREVKRFEPKLLGISAGFDAFRGDPIAQELLEVEDYHWLGQSIRALGIPAFSVLEGGYSVELPDLIFAYLKGWEGL